MVARVSRAYIAAKRKARVTQGRIMPLNQSADLSPNGVYWSLDPAQSVGEDRQREQAGEVDGERDAAERDAHRRAVPEACRA